MSKSLLYTSCYVAVFSFETGKYKYTDNFLVDVTESGMANSRGSRKGQRLILFYKIVNKIASIFRLTAFWLQLTVEQVLITDLKLLMFRLYCDSYRHSFFPATISD